MQPDRRQNVFRLSRIDGVGPERVEALLSLVGESGRAPSMAEIESLPGFGRKLASRVMDALSSETWRAEWEEIARRGFVAAAKGDDAYPPPLADVPDAPMILTLWGRWRPEDSHAVAVVGSRDCSSYGIAMAETLSKKLAENGVTIVSGLARGIDGAAHRSALTGGGRTLAVMASGLANVYPPEHRQLAAEIADRGAVMSEAPLDGAPLAGLFLRRNRVLSGLSRAVLVVEAGMRSGALSTARHALEQGRDVLAVPGRVGDRMSEGTLELIRNGAGVVTKVEDVLLALGRPLAPRPAVPSIPPDFAAASQETASARAEPQGLDPKALAVWGALTAEPSDIDSLAERLNLSVAELNVQLFLLEAKRLVARHPGNRFARRS